MARPAQGQVKISCKLHCCFFLKFSNVQNQTMPWWETPWRQLVLIGMVTSPVLNGFMGLWSRCTDCNAFVRFNTHVMVTSPVLNSHAADAKRRDCNAIFHYKNSLRDRDPCRPGLRDDWKVEMVNLESRTGTFPPIIMMLHRRSLSAHCLFALFLIKCLLSSSFFWHIFQHVRSVKLLLASSADIAVSISAREKTTRTLSEEAK